MSRTVEVESVREHVRLVRMSRPQRLNALSVQLCLELREALERIAAENSTWVVILTGAGRAFSAGLDLKDHGVIPNAEGLTAPRLAPRAMRLYSQLIPTLRGLPQPVIAAIRGPAFGGGLCLSLAADLRIAGESAVFNATGIVNGLTSTELGASWLLPRLVGAAHANDVLLTGRRFGAEEAFRMGLVSRVVPDERLIEEAIGIAERMCEFSPYGLQMTKQVLWANLETPSLAAALELEDRNQLMLGMTDNLPEAIDAFDQRRKPIYTDRPRRDLFREPKGNPSRG